MKRAVGVMLALKEFEEKSDFPATHGTAISRRQITTQPPCSCSAVLQVQFKFFGAHERIGAKFCRFAVTTGCRREPRDRSRAGCVECAGRQDVAAAALLSASELIPEQEMSRITA
jgi:hypothetical protein